MYTCIPIFLHTYLPSRNCLHTYLPTCDYLHDLPTYMYTCTPNYLHTLTAYIPTYIPACNCLHTYLPAYNCLHNYLPAYNCIHTLSLSLYIYIHILYSVLYNVSPKYDLHFLLEAKSCRSPVGSQVVDSATLLHMNHIITGVHVCVHVGYMFVSGLSLDGCSVPYV